MRTARTDRLSLVSRFTAPPDLTAPAEIRAPRHYRVNSPGEIVGWVLLMAALLVFGLMLGAAAWFQLWVRRP